MRTQLVLPRLIVTTEFPVDSLNDLNPDGPEKPMKNMMSVIFSIFPALGIFLCIIAFCGCHAFHTSVKDATNRPEWWGQLSKNQILLLTRDVLLTQTRLSFGTHVKKADGTYQRISIEEFKGDPKWSVTLPNVHLLTKGTHLRCIRLERVFSFEYSAYRVFAEVIDGEHQGEIAEIPVTGNPNEKKSLRLSGPVFELVP